MVAAVPCWMPWAETWEWECFLAIPNGSIRVSGCWGGCWNFACRLLLDGACLYRLGVGKRKKELQYKIKPQYEISCKRWVAFALLIRVSFCIESKGSGNRTGVGRSNARKTLSGFGNVRSESFTRVKMIRKLHHQLRQIGAAASFFFFGLH